MPDTRTRVLQVTWNWRQTAGNRTEGTAGLRRAAVVQAVVMGAIAALLIHVWHHLLTGRIIAALATAILFLGLTAPRAYRPLRDFGQLLGRGVGTVLVHVLLVPFFFLFFVPAALLLRVLGRDPLHRRFRDSRWTYWISRQPRPRGYNITKQFLHEDRAARDQLRTVGSLPRRDPEGRS